MLGGFSISPGAALKNVIQGAVNSRRAASEVDKIGSRGYDIALMMVGNAGQLTIITAIGEAGFQEAAEIEYDADGEAIETLMIMASHPEAVIEILGEVGAGITDEVQELKAKEGAEAKSPE